MKIIEALMILTSIFTSFTIQAAVQVKLNKDLGKTQFIAVGNPGFLKIEGHGKGPEGALTVEQQKLSGSIEVDLNSLDTGMSLRNRHMKEKYLKTNEHPKATLKFVEAPLAPTWKPQTPAITEHTLPATLTVQNTTKPVDVRYTIASNGTLTAKFQIKITDFNIEIPSFMNVTVADSVDVAIESQLKIEVAP